MDQQSLPAHLLAGQEKERTAEQFLLARGLKLQQRNFRSKVGEIDLIMMDNDTLVFVEVRYRSNPNFGHPAETVDYRKQRKLIRCAQFYLQQQYGDHPPPCRFDVMAASEEQGESRFEWIKDAIGA
ncbi:YraN family protein [Pseudomaricurvus alkylphenolicus]|jgi:putative endonuclease|uniref:YraN family protein n=1 Tax=Pseudomaricurvus alkylphenolicus TaxID=1306991 RepID=UPI00141DF43B|nr:YraN family protein [Pseudomaricurvus alkylphenolicus]NIB40086.1 YraN family protein [Pseudomaricurvus alkylphenolicus]